MTPAGIHQGMPKSGQITLRLPDGTAKAVTVVGEASLLDPNVGMPSLLTTEVWEGANFWQTQRLLQRSTPVSWDEVKKLNEYGLTVVSRAAIENPPVVADRTPLGRLLRGIPPPVGAHPAFATAVDPIARLVLRGVRTRGTARAGRREWYAARDHHRVTSLTGRWDGVDLGRLAPVDPPTRFGFSSTPRTPALTAVTTTIQLEMT